MDLNNITKEKFNLVDRNKKITDVKFDTKPVGYFKDAWNRFKKNKVSVVAACILAMLFLYAIFVPMFSRYDLSFFDEHYKNALPKVFKSGTGFWDGCEDADFSRMDFDQARAKGVEYELWKGIIKSGDAAGIGTDGVRNEVISLNGKTLGYFEDQTMYHVRRDTYLKVGFKYDSVPYEEYLRICEYQNQTGIRVIYPMIDYKQIIPNVRRLAENNANYWYKYTASHTLTMEDINGMKIQFDTDGNFQENYARIENETELTVHFVPYNSIRQPGDPGIGAGADGEDADIVGVSFAYGRVSEAGKAVEESNIRIRVSWYDYFTYKYGAEPGFVFGLNSDGKDIFVNIAYGARTSFMLAIAITSINLLLGALIGAWMGYRGGWTDLIGQRVMDIIYAIPFTVSIVLFQLHLQPIVGIVGTIIFAYVFTGWMGTAGTVRAQFYIYKGREYVLAARTLGAGDRRLMWKHIFPNSIGRLITGSILAIPAFVFSEATLSYLGIIRLDGANMISLGVLLEQGQRSIPDFPHGLLFTATFIALLMICFNLFGNGLRDAFNPNLRGTGE